MFSDENKIAFEQIQTVLIERYELCNTLQSLQQQLRTNTNYINIDFKCSIELPWASKSVYDYKSITNKLLYVRKEESKRSEMEQRYIEIISRNQTLSLVERMAVHKLCYTILRLWKPSINFQKTNQHDFKGLVQMFKLYAQSEQDQQLQTYIQGLLDSHKNFSMSSIIILLNYLLGESRLKLTKLLDDTSISVQDRMTLINEVTKEIPLPKKRYANPARIRINQDTSLSQYRSQDNTSISQDQKVQKSQVVSSQNNYNKLNQYYESLSPINQKAVKRAETKTYISSETIKSLYSPLSDFDINHYVVQQHAIKDKLTNEKGAYCNQIKYLSSLKRGLQSMDQPNPKQQ